MGMFTTLDAVNDMLGLLGEADINSLDVGHPLANKAQRFLRVANVREQSKGWWFNTEAVTLVPTAEGTIFTPDDTLKVDPTSGNLSYAQRGRKLYNLAPGSTSPYFFATEVPVELVRLVPYEELPAAAQLLVNASAQLTFMTDMDGDAAKITLIQQAVREALVILNCEHIRARDVNLLATTSFQAAFGRIGGSSASRITNR